MGLWYSKRKSPEEDQEEYHTPAVAGNNYYTAARVGQQEFVKNGQQNKVISDAVKAAEGLKKQYGNCAMEQKAGWMAETFHEASFNVDAIEKNVPLRAARVPGNTPVDLQIIDTSTGAEVAQVQIKIGQKACVAKLQKPVYDGMQKIVATDMEDVTKEYRARILAGGVKSRSVKLGQRGDLVKSPSRFFRSLKPSVLKDAQQCGLQAAAVGASMSAAFSLTATYATKGEVTGKDVAQAAKAAVVGGTSSGAAAAIAVLSGSVAAGGAVGGLVSTVVAVMQSPDRATSYVEAVQGVGGTAAAVAGMALCTTFGVATGGLGFILPVGVSIVSSMAGRAVARAAVGGGSK